MKNKELRNLLVIAALVLVLVSVAVVFFKAQQKSSDNPKDGPVRVSAELLYREGAHSKGPMTAKVRIVEFLDPECESCAAMHPYVKRILKEYPQEVVLTVRYMPFHGNSVFAASLLEAAAVDGKYWQLMEALFHYQSEWASHHDPRPEKTYDIAKQIGLDAELLRKRVAEKKEEYAALVEVDRKAGQSLGVRGTPTFYVNGRLLESLGYDSLKALIDEELAR